MAAGVPAMFETRTPNSATIGGYVVMRLAVVAQWLRAAQRRSRPPHHRAAIRLGHHAAADRLGRACCSCQDRGSPRFLVLRLLELAVPVWAERAGPTTWHPHHIAERYGLLTLIVLGESILAATMAVQAALASGESAVRAAAADRRRAADRVLDVVDVFRPARPRPAHEPAHGDRLGLRPLRGLRGGGRRGRRAGGRRRPGRASRDDRPDGAGAAVAIPVAAVPDVPVVSPLPARRIARPGYWARSRRFWSCSRR